MNEGRSPLEWDDSPELEQWVERMLRDGNTGLVKTKMQRLPEEKKAKYRAIWKRVMKETL